MVSFGVPWPELNADRYYRDLIRPSDAGATLIDFYTRKYKNSAPLQGEGEELVYHRLPWKEPDAPYLLEILYEDKDVQFLKDMLKLLCVYNNKGANQGSYELKHEYRRSDDKPDTH